MSKQPERFDDIVLRIGLPRIDDVVDRLYSAEVWSSQLRGGDVCRDPAIADVGRFFAPAWSFKWQEWFALITEKLPVAKVFPRQQSEFPEVIGDVFSDVGHGVI